MDVTTSPTALDPLKSTHHQYHVEGARAVDAFDALQLDIARRGGPADPRHRASRVEAAQRVLDVREHLVLGHDADVQIRNERQCPPSLVRSMVENDGPRLGDTRRPRG